MKFTKIFAYLILSTLIITPTLWAKGMGSLAELKLTADQKKTIKEIRKTSRAGFKEKHVAIKALHEKLQAGMKTGASDDELRRLFAETQTAIQPLRAEMAKARFESILAIRQVLDPEQRKKFNELKGKMLGRKGKSHDDDSEKLDAEGDE